MAELDNVLDLASISGDTTAGESDIVSAGVPDGSYTLPPDLLSPITTSDSIFQQRTLEPSPSTTPPSTVDPRVRMAVNILALLMAGGGLAGIGQQLLSGGREKTVTPRLLPEARQAFEGAQQQFGQTGGILQQLLGALQNPQIPPGLSLLTEQAFQPQLGALYAQAAEAGRRRGFHDAPGTSPPGGAILGPGLADLQGQLAQAKLNLYQNNIGNLLRALSGSQGLAQGQGQLATQLPAGHREQVPPPTILDVLGKLTPILGGIGGLLGAVNPKEPSSSLSGS